MLKWGTAGSPQPSRAGPASAAQPTTVASRPVGSYPITSGPVTSGPVTSGPVTSGPVTSAPVAGGPVESSAPRALLFTAKAGKAVLRTSMNAMARAMSHDHRERLTRARIAFVLVVPVLLLPLPLYYRSKPSWCGYCMLLMATYWATEALPLPITALLPMVIFPLTGTLDADDTAKNYFNEVRFTSRMSHFASAQNIGVVIFSSLVFAAAVEVTHLDQRVALNALRMVGSSNDRLMFGFMFITMLLSMWIPNTAATSIVCPIVMTVVDHMRETAASARKGRTRVGGFVRPEQGLDEDTTKRVRKLMLLAVAYSSNIGGTGSLIGTPPNMVLSTLMEKHFPTAREPTFVSWMVYNVPIMFGLLIVAWLYMRFLLQEALGSAATVSEENAERIMREIVKRCDELGHITFSESVVTFLMTLMVLLMFSQKPHFMPGWSDIFPYSSMIRSSVPMVVMLMLLFIIPRETNMIGQAEQAIITWEDVCNHVNWGIVLLICGGMTIADASKKSGLTDMMVVGMEALDAVPDTVVVMLLCITSSVMTEFTSNAAISKFMLPVVLETAMHRRVHPLYFGIPTTIGCSFAFMLPASTPPNAIVYHLGRMTPGDMIGPGFLMNLICVMFEIAAIHTIGSLVFDVYQFPEWASSDMARGF